jgi:hypothetical protein
VARRRPACAQVSGQAGVSASVREFPPLTARSGTQWARRPWWRATVATLAPWSSSPSSDLMWRDCGTSTSMAVRDFQLGQASACGSLPK